jgi:membrane-associated phospholipid phosphatase
MQGRLRLTNSGEMAGRVSLLQPVWWYVFLILLTTSRFVRASEFPEAFTSFETGPDSSLPTFEQLAPPFSENFPGGFESSSQIGRSIDADYEHETDGITPAWGYRGLSEIEDRFSSVPQEFIQVEDLESESPGISDFPIRQEWSTFGRGMSLSEFAWNDAKTAFFTLDDDFLAFWKPRNVLFVGAGLGLSIGLRQSVDENTRAYVNQHPKRWSSITESLGCLGNTEYQIAALLALYDYSFQTENEELMKFTQLLIRTYTLTGLSTIAIKLIADTKRPSIQWMDGNYGFPSAHSSTSFAIAATIDEYYGPKVGIPAYILAGLIGWSRIDEQDHDVSDVVFGAFLGYAIAKSIAGRELRGDSRIQFFPWTDPNRGTYGAMFEVDY